jgi:hypothetical protein
MNVKTRADRIFKAIAVKGFTGMAIQREERLLRTQVKGGRNPGAGWRVLRLTHTPRGLEVAIR